MLLRKFRKKFSHKISSRLSEILSKHFNRNIGNRLGLKSMRFVQMNHDMANRVLENYFFNQFKRTKIHNDLGASFTQIERKRGRIFKKAQENGEAKLQDEIHWIREFTKKHRVFKKHLPHIYRYGTKKGNTFFEMKYYNYPNLRKTIIDEINYSRVIRKRFRHILLFFLKHFYTEQNSIVLKEKPVDFVQAFHLNKWRARIEVAKQQAPFLAPLIDGEVIKINDCHYFSPRVLLEQVEKNKTLLTNLTPKRLYHSHGDLHTNNVLCGFFPNDFILLDCRGKSPSNTAFYDVAYDIGKLYHDLRSLYSLIEKHYFTIVMFTEKDLINIRYNFVNQKLVRSFYQYFQFVQNFVSNHFTEFGNVNYRASFTEAMLYLSMVPMHLKHKTEGLMCLVTGIVRLNEWFAKYHEDLYNNISKTTQ